MTGPAVQELAVHVGGIKPACALLGASRATWHRRSRPPVQGCARPRGRPAHALSDAERARVLAVLAEPRFADKSVAQVWATLLDEGVYLCSQATMHRLLRAAGQAGDRRRQATHPSHSRPELHATAPVQVWSWDITKLKGPARGEYFDCYVVLDIFSRLAVGWTVAAREDARIAEDLLRATIGRHGRPRSIHADRGTSMTSKPVAQLLVDLGVDRSHSRPHVSNDNPYSESTFKTAPRKWLHGARPSGRGHHDGTTQVFAGVPRRSGQDGHRDVSAIADVARDLGLNEGTLGNWVNKYRQAHVDEEAPLSITERARLRELERENRDLKLEREPGKSRRLLREQAPLTEVYDFVLSEKANYPVVRMCDWLHINRASFYAWCSRTTASGRARRRVTLAGLVRASFDASGGTYGARRVAASLRRGGQPERPPGRRLMADRKPRPFRATTRRDPAAPQGVPDARLHGHGARHHARRGHHLRAPATEDSAPSDPSSTATAARSWAGPATRLRPAW